MRVRPSGRGFLGHERRRGGQSVVEFALVLPVLLLLLLIGIDFGRVFLGWINLQTMVRNAANFAANNPQGWVPTPGDAAIKSRYAALVQQDAKAINCLPQSPLPEPQFSGTNPGSNVKVEITCRFDVITPVISNVVGKQIVVHADTTFPVKTGAVTGVYGGGAPPISAPVASFIASPTSGNSPLAVTFLDTSTNGPTSWVWTFGDTISATSQNPTHSYQAAGTFNVSLTACNIGGCGTSNATITVTPAPTTGPVPRFTATPRSGPFPLTVTFTDQSTGTVTSRSWAFGDGGTSTVANPTHLYNAVGVYTVSLTVSDGSTANPEIRTGYIVVGNSPCVVPNFTGVLKNGAQSVWSAKGFTTQVQKQNGSGNYSIQYQSLPAFQENPPGGCGAVIQVGP